MKDIERWKKGKSSFVVCKREFFLRSNLWFIYENILYMKSIKNIFIG